MYHIRLFCTDRNASAEDHTPRTTWITHQTWNTSPKEVNISWQNKAMHRRAAAKEDMIRNNQTKAEKAQAAPKANIEPLQQNHRLSTKTEKQTSVPPGISENCTFFLMWTSYRSLCRRPQHGVVLAIDEILVIWEVLYLFSQFCLSCDPCFFDMVVRISGQIVSGLDVS